MLMKAPTDDGPVVLMATPEVRPFALTGGLGDVLAALPAALTRVGVKTAVVVPRYQRIDLNSLEYLGSIQVWLNIHTRKVADIFQAHSGKVTCYFVDCPEYFERSGMYGEGMDYLDNHIRFGFFSRAVIELAKALLTPRILHCHDWQTALIPTLLKSAIAEDSGTAFLKTVLTIHNLGYQGIFESTALADIGLPARLFDTRYLEFYGKVNLLKGGIVFSDRITTVSPTYAKEIQGREMGFGLDGLLSQRAGELKGILNGVDYSAWDPSLDPLLPVTYTPENQSGKILCKQELLKEFGLPASCEAKPLLGLVSRFAAQKGFNLLAEIADDLVALDCAVVALGTGEPGLEEFFRAWVARYPEQVAVRIGFDNGLAHRLEAGADIFLMPSLYEPCGLNQMYSLKYGTIPVVRRTGGLDDAVGDDTGFKFDDATGAAFLDAIQRAVSVFRNRPAEWASMRKRGMLKDFSWECAAREYRDLYLDLCPDLAG